MLIYICIISQNKVDYHHILANIDPMKDGKMNTTAAMSRAIQSIMQMFLLNFLPKSWPISFNGFQDHLIRPSGLGKCGHILGSDCP